MVNYDKLIVWRQYLCKCPCEAQRYARFVSFDGAIPQYADIRK